MSRTMFPIWGLAVIRFPTSRLGEAWLSVPRLPACPVTASGWDDFRQATSYHSMMPEFLNLILDLIGHTPEGPARIQVIGGAAFRFQRRESRSFSPIRRTKAVKRGSALTKSHFGSALRKVKRTSRSS